MSERASTKTQMQVSISLEPRAGFCIKTMTLEGATLPTPHGKPSTPTPIPTGLKVFINIAWDVNAPPSPQGSEESIERVLNGEEDIEEESMGGLYIPAIVPPPREDTDKAGNPSLVFDCIYNTTVKARISRNKEYKAFIVELALQRIEGQTGLILSRDIRTPNIPSKGKLLPRTAHVPASLLLETPTVTQSSGNSRPTLNERATSNQTSSSSTTGALDPKEDQSMENENKGHEAFSQAILGMLKALPTTEPKLPTREPSPTRSSQEPLRKEGTPVTSTFNRESRTPLGHKAEVVIQKIAPRWSWRREDSGFLRIEVEIPELTTELAQRSILDVEPRRLLLRVPHRDTLDLNLALPDAEIEKYWTGGDTSTMSIDSEEDRVPSNIRNTLNLKRERDLDVDRAEAEWKVVSGVVVIRV